MLKSKFITFNEYIRKEEKSKISNISFYLRKLYKEEQFKFEVRRIKEIKIRAETNDIENRKSIEKLNENIS